MTQEAIVEKLSATGLAAEQLRREANALRAERKGDDILLRGIIEFTNYCRNVCTYCGINATQNKCVRYRMERDEIVSAAEVIRSAGIGTVVLQSGDDPFYTCEKLCEIIRAVRATGIQTITLSIGIRPPAELAAFREAGAGRFLLRFESSDPKRFSEIHPDETFEQRNQALADIRAAGFELGTGFMIGLPGETLEDVARNLLHLQSLKPDMIGCGPYIPDPDTPLGQEALRKPYPPFPLDVYCNVVALLRLMNPDANIPATTAFDALMPDGREQSLACGSNVYMPNFTPMKYRGDYMLYPGKPGVDSDPQGLAEFLCASPTLYGRPIDRTGR